MEFWKSINKVWYYLMVAVSLVVLGGTYTFLSASKTEQVTTNVQAPERIFTVITTEFKSKTADGKVLEVYRWDPGTIVVQRGDRVTLKFVGVQGRFHPFIIKDLNIKGEVKRGKETVVSFLADKPGTYEIVCQGHADLAHNGPMVGHLIVLDK